MKSCPYCGKELPEELQFCPYCMEKLTEETPVGGTLVRKRRPLWLWSIGAALLLLIPLLVWRLWPDDPPKPAPDLSSASSADDSTQNTDPADSTTSARQTSGHNGNHTETTTTHSKRGQSTTSTADTTRTTAGTKKTGKPTSATKKPPASTTEAICAGGHDWVPLTTTVRHDEQGHYEEQENGTVKITIYKCAICYKKHDSMEDYYTHFETHLASSDPLIEVFRDRYETDTEYRTTYTQVWVVDQKAYDETVTVGRRCQRCGKTEEND